MELLNLGAALVGPLACGILVLQRTLHMYQLNGYQTLSYTNYLKANRKETWSVKRVLPALLLAAGAAVSWGWVLILLGTALFLLINQPPKAKKPLVYTPRVKRLLANAGVCWLLWNVGTYALFMQVMLRALEGSALATGVGGLAVTVLYIVRLPAEVLLQPYLILFYNCVNHPLEQAISNRFYREAEDTLRGMPNLTVIGITGSYGKTSVKYCLNQLLSVKYNVYMTPGNYNTTLGVVRSVREGLRPTHEIFLCEMGARHVGDIDEICRLAQPHMGIITSIGPQHLETFGTVDAIVGTKLELAQAVRGRGPVFLNFDSPLVAAQTYDQERITYGIRGQAYRVTDVTVDGGGSVFTVTAPDGSAQVFRTRLLGSANVQNITGAIAVAHHLGISLRALAPAVRQLEGAPHRLQLIPAGTMTIIDDAYNSNPAGAAVALETLALCRGGRIAVTPGLVELGDAELEYNQQLGAKAALCCDRLILVGSQPRIEAIRRGALQAGLTESQLFQVETVQEAMILATQMQLPDKMVLLLNDLTDNY